MGLLSAENLTTVVSRPPRSGDVAPQRGGMRRLVFPAMAGSEESLETIDEVLDASASIRAIGVAAVAFGILLRFMSWSPMWLDEALSVNIARLPITGGSTGGGSVTGANILEALRHDGHPPFYYLLLHGWMDLFGTSNLAIRSMSALFGLLCLPLAFVLGRRRGGSLLGWIAVSVVALSPFAVRYSAEARMYSLIMLLVFAGWLLLDDLVRLHRSSLVRHAALVLITAALLYTQYWSLWLCAAIGLVMLWFAFRSDDLTTRSAARRVVVCLLCGLVLFLPWLPTMLYQSAHTGTPWASAMRPTAMIAWTLCVFAFGDYADAALFAGVLLITILLALFAYGRTTRSIEVQFRPRAQFATEGLVVVLLIVISSAMSFLAGAGYAPRYASVYFPLLAVIIAAGVTRFLAPRIRLVVALVVLVPMLGGSALSARETRSQSRQIVDAIAAETIQTGNVLVVCPDQLGPGISRELDLRSSGPLGLTAFSYPGRDDLHFVDWVDYKQRNDAADPTAFARDVLTLAASSPGRQVFFVWNGEYRTFDGDCEAIAGVLGSAMSGVELVESSSSAFEHASLIKYQAR